MRDANGESSKRSLLALLSSAACTKLYCYVALKSLRADIFSAIRILRSQVLLKLADHIE